MAYIPAILGRFASFYSMQKAAGSIESTPWGDGDGNWSWIDAETEGEGREGNCASVAIERFDRRPSWRAHRGRQVSIDGAAQVGIVKAPQGPKDLDALGNVADDALSVDQYIVVIAHVVGSQEASPIPKNGKSSPGRVDEALHGCRVAVPAVDGENAKRLVLVVLPNLLDDRPGRAALHSPISHEGQEHGLAGEPRKGDRSPRQVLKREIGRHLAGHDGMRNRRQAGDKRKGEQHREKAMHSNPSGPVDMARRVSLAVLRLAGATLPSK